MAKRRPTGFVKVNPLLEFYGSDEDDGEDDDEDDGGIQLAEDDDNDEDSDANQTRVMKQVAYVSIVAC